MPVQNAVTSSSRSLASCMLVELPIVEMYGDDNDDEAIVNQHVYMVVSDVRFHRLNDRLLA